MLEPENTPPPGASVADPTELQAPQPLPSYGPGQHIAFSIALLCYLCGALCLAAIPVWVGDLGHEHPVIASLGASVVFFVGAGIVLHVIGRANLPDLRVGTEGSAGFNRDGG